MKRTKTIKSFDDSMDLYLNNTKKYLKGLGVKGKISNASALDFIIKTNASILPIIKDNIKRSPKNKRGVIIEV